MPDLTKNIDIKVGGKDAGATATLDAIEKRVEHLKKTAGSDAFDSIRESFGRRSALGESAELLRGGGPVAGLTAAAEAVKGLGEGFGHLKDTLNDSKLTAGEMVDKIAGGIPIVGEFWNAGKAIREQFDGTAEALEKDKELTEEIAVQTKLAAEYQKTAVESAKQYAAYQKAATDQIILAQTPAADRPAKQAELAGHNKAEDIQATRDANIGKLNTDADKAVADLNGKLEELRQKQNDSFRRPAWLGGQSDEDIGADMQRIGNEINGVNAKRAAAIAKEKEEANKATVAVGRASAQAEMDAQSEATEKHQQAVDAANERDAKTATDAAAQKAEALDQINGNQQDAELVGMRKARDEKLAELTKQRAEEKKLYAPNDKTSQDAVDARFSGMSQAVKDAEAMQEAARKAKDEAKEWDDVIDQVGEDESKKWENAHKIIEDTLSPLDKYKQKLEEISDARASGYMTEAQAAQAAAKAAQESGIGGPMRYAALEETHGSGIGAAMKERDSINSNNPAARAAKAAEKTAANTDKINGILADMFSNWPGVATSNS